MPEGPSRGQHPEGQDAGEAPEDAGFAAKVDTDVDDDLDPTHPRKRLAEARKQIALAMDDLDVDGDGRMTLWTDDEGREVRLQTSGDRFSIRREVDPDRLGEHLLLEASRDRALLVANCLRTIAADR